MAKRIRTRIDGKLISISAEDWSWIRRRFNPKPTPNSWPSTACPFCIKYADRGCRGCPLHKFHKKTGPVRLGCMVVFTRILGTAADLSPLAGWDKKDEKKAKKLMARIDEYLDEVEAQQ